jgi:hypothetical protein
MLPYNSPLQSNAPKKSQALSEAKDLCIFSPQANCIGSSLRSE